MDLLQEQVVGIFGTVLTVIAGYAVKQLKSYLDQKGVTQKLKAYESSARIAVSAVEQIYINEDGPTKLTKAKFHMAQSLQNKGMSIDADDLQYWIESAVHGMNSGWKDKTKD